MKFCIYTKTTGLCFSFFCPLPSSVMLGFCFISFVYIVMLPPHILWLRLSKGHAAKSLQLCPTLCYPTDGSPPGCPIPGILQARTLEWVAISFSNAWKEKWKWSLSVVSDSSRPHGLQPTRLLPPWDFPGKSTGVGCHCFLRGDTLTRCFSKNQFMWLWGWLGKSEICRAGCQEGQAEVSSHGLKLLFISGISSSLGKPQFFS